MMGQQDTAAAGSALRRMILLLAVAAVMVAMAMATAAEAFALPPADRGSVNEEVCDVVGINAPTDKVQNRNPCFQN